MIVYGYLFDASGSRLIDTDSTDLFVYERSTTMSDQATGALSKMVIGFEDVATGTAATAGFEVPFISSSLSLNKNKTVSQVIDGDYNPKKPSSGNKLVSGQVVVPLDSIATWYWFSSMFNTLTTSGTDPYDHEFKMAGTTKRTALTIEHQYLDLDTPQYFQYLGCKINQASVSVGGEGELIMTMDIVGISRTVDTSSFDGSATDIGYGPLDNSDASLKEGGSAYADSTTVDFSIGFNVQTDQYVIGGGGELGDVPDGRMAVSGNNTFLFKDLTLLNKGINDTETSLEFTFTQSASSQIIIEFPELQYAESDPGIPGPQGLLVTLPWQAYYDDNADSSSVVVTVTNGEAHA